MVRRASWTVLLLCLICVSLTLSLSGCDKKPSFSTPYQVVLLDNGQAYFGKIDNFGRDYLLLTDIFYIQTAATPEGKIAGNVLIKRGKEWHSPDKMYVNTKHVIMIEPVAVDSKVGELIREEKAKSGEPKK